MNDGYPEHYSEAIRLFNAEDFFECHDVLEEIWSECQGPEKRFLQGMIQSAIALFHFGNENFGGAKKLYLSSKKYLEAYEPEYMGIALGEFLVDFDRCFEELMSNTEVYPTTVELADELVPKIRTIDAELSQ